jgi:hypothetical protein
MRRSNNANPVQTPDPDTHHMYFILFILHSVVQYSLENWDSILPGWLQYSVQLGLRPNRYYALPLHRPAGVVLDNKDMVIVYRRERI